MGMVKWLGEFLFVPVDKSMRSRVLAGIFLLLVFLGGVTHWVYFFHGGQMTFQANDWPKEYSYYTVLQQSVKELRLPFHMDHPFQGTYRFLANPEVVLSPQVILLRWLSVGQFVLANTLIMYTLFFIGCLLIMRKFDLPPFAFLVMVLLAGFNGYITAHLAAGHSMWNGFFLLPFFALLLIELVSQKPTVGIVIKLSLVLFGMFLQGSFHMVVWCWMFLVFLAAASWRLIKPVLGVLGGSLVLAAVRLIPTLMTFSGFSFPYISGYPDLHMLWDALTELRTIDTTHLGGFFGTLGWQEYDAYIGLAGVMFVLVFGIVYRLKKGEEWDAFRFQPLDVPIILLTFLSVNYSFAVLAKLNLPLVAGERVASRFIIIPLTMLIILGGLRFGQFLPKVSRSIGAKVLLVALFLDLVTAIGLHSYNWRISRMENSYPKVLVDMAYHILDVPDPGYVAGFWVGVVITSLGLVGVILYFALIRKREFNRRYSQIDADKI